MGLLRGVLALSSVLLVAAPVARATEGLVETVQTGCKTELDSFCAKVTPGEGRLLACLYAYGDKLSGKCEYALYDASVRLERAVAALSYVANECDADIDSVCSDVQMGEGRILKCLEKNDKKVSRRCKDAIAQVGLK
jgi:hypothetical protein